MPISAHGTGDESTTHCLQEQDNHFTGSNSKAIFKRKLGYRRDQSLHLHKAELLRGWPSDPWDQSYPKSLFHTEIPKPHLTLELRNQKYWMSDPRFGILKHPWVIQINTEF